MADSQLPGMPPDPPDSSKAGRLWNRHVPPGERLDRAEADAETLAAITAEQSGEWDPATGQFRPSSWDSS